MTTYLGHLFEGAVFGGIMLLIAISPSLLAG
jgi:hypothetical protein